MSPAPDAKALSLEDARALAAQHGLIRVDSVGGFGKYLSDTWKMRHFAIQYAVGRIISLSAKNRLGLLWEFLTPLTTALMYFIAFGYILGTRKDSPNFIFFLVAGVLTWQLFIQSFNLSSQSLISGKDLSASMRFPRVLIPLSSGIQALVRTLPTVLLLYPVALFTGVSFRWQWLFLPFHMVLVVLCGLAFGLLVVRVVNRVRDFTEAIPILTRFLMFTSGIFYSVSIRFADAPKPVRLFAENQPVAMLLNVTRGLFIHEDMPGRNQLIVLVVGVFTLLLIGLILFWRGERPRG